MIITSAHNDKLKEIRKLGRRRERAGSGRFVAEGEDLVAAADAAGWTPVHLLCAADSGLAGEEVEPALLDAVSSLGSGTRTIGVYAARWSEPRGPLCVYLHGVGDPGNVGAVLRSALAFGAGSVVLGPGCADPYGPKSVRASMGAVFAIALTRADGPDALPGTRIALSARQGDPLSAVLSRGATTSPGQDGGGDPATVLLVGAERTGLPAPVMAACDHVAHIPIATDSLNAAMAATVALYEMTTARRMAPE